MAEKTVYIPFTVDSEKELTDKQVITIANLLRPTFRHAGLEDDANDKVRCVAEFNDWCIRPAKTLNEVLATKQN